VADESPMGAVRRSGPGRFRFSQEVYPGAVAVRQGDQQVSGDPVPAAEMAMGIDIMHTITWKAAWMHDQSVPAPRRPPT